MSNFLFLSTQHPFEEKEEQIKETYKNHCKEYDLKEGEYWYPYAYGGLTAAYKWLYADYLKLKEEYEKNLAEATKLLSQ